jgi:hypothetical protein
VTTTAYVAATRFQMQSLRGRDTLGEKTRTRMAWTIHSWSADRGTGSIVSPHFDPLPFEAKANVDQVTDFLDGEPVLVELSGDAPHFRVDCIRPTSQRQPEGTHWAPFDAVNGRFSDVWLEERSPTSVQFWLGECCEYCTPDPLRLRFQGVVEVVGLDDDVAFDDPLFCLASPGEVQQHSLDVPSGHRAFCVVTSHGHGIDGPPLFIVARTAGILGQPQAP